MKGHLYKFVILLKKTGNKKDDWKREVREESSGSCWTGNSPQL